MGCQIACVHAFLTGTHQSVSKRVLDALDAAEETGARFLVHNIVVDAARPFHPLLGLLCVLFVRASVGGLSSPAFRRNAERDRPGGCSDRVDAVVVVRARTYCRLWLCVG